MSDIEQLVDRERTALVTVLEGLDREQWSTPSLCAGWSVRDLVVHLLMPYEASTPRFLAKMAAARFDFDRVADRWARSDTRSGAELVQALRATAGKRFNVPGSPPEAPLSHLVVHAEDVYRPLRVPHQVGPDAGNTVLAQLTSERARRALRPGLLDGLALTADDTGWRYGDGPQVAGTAAALITTIAGRSAALDELSGDGVAQLRARLAA